MDAKPDPGTVLVDKTLVVQMLKKLRDQAADVEVCTDEVASAVTGFDWALSELETLPVIHQANS